MSSLRVMDCTKWEAQEKKNKKNFLDTVLKTQKITEGDIIVGRIIQEVFFCPQGKPYRNRGEVVIEVTVTITVDFSNFNFKGGRNYLKLESRIDGFDCYSKTNDPKQLEQVFCMPDFKAVSKWKNEHDLTMEEWILGLIKYSNLLVPTEQEKNKGKTRQQIIMEEKRKFQEEMRSSRIQRI